MVTGFFSNILGLGGQAPVTKIESESDEEMEVSLYISLNFLQATEGLRQTKSGITKRIERSATQRALKV